MIEEQNISNDEQVVDHREFKSIKGLFEDIADRAAEGYEFTCCDIPPSYMGFQAFKNNDYSNRVFYIISIKDIKLSLNRDYDDIHAQIIKDVISDYTSKIKLLESIAQAGKNRSIKNV